jgi:hypothetical protein
MSTADLAEQVLKVLDKQAEYFKMRDRSVLIMSKQMEAALRQACIAEIRAAVANKPKQAILDHMRRTDTEVEF